MAERLECLREMANEGTLTVLEQADYEEFVEGSDILMLIKDHARSSLRRG